MARTLKRGELWTIAGGADYAGKPRPALILQSDAYSDTESVTLCPLTSNISDSPTFRLVIEPTAANGLARESWIMADKLSSVARRKLGKRIGVISEEDMTRAELAIMTFLGFAG